MAKNCPKIAMICDQAVEVMVFVYICLRCQIFTRLIATKFSLELLTEMELGAELATQASHL